MTAGSTTKLELTAKTILALDGTLAETIWDSRIAGFGLRTRRSSNRALWRWVLRYRIGGRGGEQPRLSQHFRDLTPEQARRWAERERGLRGSPHGQRERAEAVKAAREAERAAPSCARLWEEYWASEGRLKRSSRYYRQLWRDHLSPTFGQMKVRDVAPADVERFKVRMAELPGACNRSLALLSVMLSRAVRWGYRQGCAPEHPVKGVARYPEGGSEFFYTEEEVGRILRAADRDRNRVGGLAIRMLCETGARAGEVTQAHWRQVEFLPDGGALWTVESSNTKTGRPITRYLDPALAALLAEWQPQALALQARISGAMWIFPQASCPTKPMVRLQHVWRRVMKEAGVRPGRIHDLRYTAATHLLRATGSLTAVQAQLGHATMLTTRRYAHVMREGMIQTGALLSGIAARAAVEAEAREKTNSVVPLGGATGGVGQA